MAEDQAAGGRRRRGRRPVRGPRARLGGRAAGRGGPRPHRRDAPQHGARDGRGRPRPVPGRPPRHRARHRERLLLRLRAAAARSRRPTSRPSRAGCAPPWPPTTPSCVARWASTRAGRSRTATARPFKVEILDDLARKAAGVGRADAARDLLRARPVPRPVQGPARRVHRAHRAVQAPRGRRRLLAGRREAPDAPADLRDGLGDPGAAGPVPVAARGGEEARPSQAGRAARPVQLPRRQPRAPPSGTRRASASGARWRPPSARSRTAATTSRSPRRWWSASACGRRPATGTCTRRTCSSSRARARPSRSSR